MDRLPSPTPSRLKRSLFWIITLLLPAVVVALLELTLRAAGLFSEEPLLLTLPKGDVYQLNRWVAKRYFDPLQVAIPELSPETFRKVKSPATFRIFCLGESTTAGFPFDCQVPFPKQLQYLLSRSFPQRRFEVVNTGISAVSSYTVLDLLPEILDASPDLLIVYLGHNEFYGAYGSGSTVSVGGNDEVVRWFLKAQGLHTVQMLRALVSWGEGLLTRPDTERTLMAAVVRDQEIPYRSTRFQETHRAFGRNLERILRMAKERNVRVIISTVFSNVLDQPPLKSISTGGDSADADVWYRAGRRMVEAGDSVAAAPLLYGAKERDVMRFRASEEVNAIILEAAKRNDALVTDLHAVFREHSPGGLVGASLVCDHLHPTPIGYYLMATAFYRTIRDLLGNPDSSFVPQAVPYHVTDLDWNIGLMRVFEMTRRLPFRERPVIWSDYRPFGDPASARIALQYLTTHTAWSSAHEAMAAEFIRRGAFEAAREEFRAITLFSPEDPSAYLQIAKTYETEERWAERERSLQEALGRSPTRGMILYQIALSQWKQNRPDRAVLTMEAAAAAPEFSRAERHNALFYLAGFLSDLHRSGDAIEVLRGILSEDPSFGPARRFLATLVKPGNRPPLLH